MSCGHVPFNEDSPGLLKGIRVDCEKDSCIHTQRNADILIFTPKSGLPIQIMVEHDWFVALATGNSLDCSRHVEHVDDCEMPIKARPQPTNLSLRLHQHDPSPGATASVRYYGATRGGASSHRHT